MNSQTWDCWVKGCVPLKLSNCDQLFFKATIATLSHQQYLSTCFPRGSPTWFQKFLAFSAGDFEPHRQEAELGETASLPPPPPAWLSKTPVEVCSFFPYPGTLLSWLGQAALPKDSICHQGFNVLKIKGIWLHSGALASHEPFPPQPPGTKAKRLEEARTMKFGFSEPERQGAPAQKNTRNWRLRSSLDFATSPWSKITSYYFTV